MEELCHFGRFEALDDRLGRLPPVIPELFAQVLERLEQGHGPALVELVCGALAVSRSGLTEAEVLDLLRRRWSGFAPADWRRLYRAIQFSLRPADDESGDGLIAFFHEQLRSAVLRRHLGMTPGACAGESDRRVHAELAEVFEALVLAEAAGSGAAISRGLLAS